jgi:hypothetical protein
VISPSIDADDLAARLDRLPTRLRDALAREFDRLIRSRTAGVPPALSLSIDTTADTVTATIRTAGLRPALPAGRRRSGTSACPAVALPRIETVARDIRTALETAARQALSE